MFLKQLEKAETKEQKRLLLVRQIEEVDKVMNEELKTGRTFAEQQQLFDKRYMVGSKLGEHAPTDKVLICMELSDKIANWCDEVKDEVVKFLNTAIQEETDTFNLATFASGGVQS